MAATVAGCSGTSKKKERRKYGALLFQLLFADFIWRGRL